MSESPGSTARHSEGSAPPTNDLEYCSFQNIEHGLKCSMLVGPGVQPRPHAQGFPVMHTSLSTLGSFTIACIPPSSPDPPLMSLTGALFQLPETLLFTIMPYFNGEADADVRDEVAENIEGFSDVVYAVTLLTVGEVLLYTAIKKGRVHKC
ncbi:uncharacterized protein EDB93DRAFT_1101879 [Suillus bovinus]|uniref:uncharacterized protein n=1 Tax=Suillus bovinus TaxID=48563 RepID=UPI001B87629F|nr:uncharacterized protein EDB93DRAFT_1101879 [Suillus bovinus]KAG2155315.1 hypothetical protein EDB93DRAFT_1101879 [Suillus bovinus]